jgi:DNA repair exonuclease SbcCD ATPase subunit
MRMTAILALALASACVTTGTYNHKVGELTKLRDDDAAAAKAREKVQADQLDKLQKSYAEEQWQLADTRAELEKANADRAALQKQLDDDTQLVTTLKQRLEKLGQNVDSLVKERGQLTQAMADTNARLEDLRKQKAAASLSSPAGGWCRRSSCRRAVRSRGAGRGWSSGGRAARTPRCRRRRPSG